MARSDDFAQQISSLIKRYDKIPDPDHISSDALINLSPYSRGKQSQQIVDTEYLDLLDIANRLAHQHAKISKRIKRGNQGEGISMSNLSREEIESRLENQQLKVDARLKEFEGKVFDGLTDMNHSLQLLDKDLAGVRGLKGTIILNSILSVIAIVGIVTAVMSYGVANFDSGRDTSAAIQEMKQQSLETRQLLEQIKAQQAAQK